jgi:diaminopimelate epimerase
MLPIIDFHAWPVIEGETKGCGAAACASLCSFRKEQTVRLRHFAMHVARGAYYPLNTSSM